jgi:hypothetical protein
MNNLFTKPYLFWDIEQAKLDIENNKRFIIERVLKYGYPVDVNILLENYSSEEIAETVRLSRALDRKTASYWAAHYHISKSEIRCLNMPLINDCFY